MVFMCSLMLSLHLQLPVLFKECCCRLVSVRIHEAEHRRSLRDAFCLSICKEDMTKQPTSWIVTKFRKLLWCSRNILTTEQVGEEWRRFLYKRIGTTILSMWQEFLLHVILATDAPLFSMISTWDFFIPTFSRFQWHVCSTPIPKTFHLRGGYSPWLLLH